MSRLHSQRTAPKAALASPARTAVAAALLGAGFFAAGAHAQSLVTVEGPLQAVTNLGGGNGNVVCNGSFIQVGAGTAITSPTATLTLEQLADSTPFVNSGFNPVNASARAGFIGGTCIVNGVRDDVTGTVTAGDVFVEIAENVLVGAVTNSPALGNGAFAVLGTPVVGITDPRMPATKRAAGFYNALGVHSGQTEVARNEFGFGVDLNTVGLPAPDIAGVEGYLGSDGVMYAHTIETTAGTLLAVDARPSIQRAQCRDRVGTGRDELEVIGSCVLAVPGQAATVTFSGHAANGTLVQSYPGSANCVPVATSPQFGTYRYSRDTLTYVGNTCPVRVRATLAGAADSRRDFVNSDNRED